MLGFEQEGLKAVFDEASLIGLKHNEKQRQTEANIESLPVDPLHVVSLRVNVCVCVCVCMCVCVCVLVCLYVVMLCVHGMGGGGKERVGAGGECSSSLHVLFICTHVEQIDSQQQEPTQSSATTASFDFALALQETLAVPSSSSSSSFSSACACEPHDETKKTTDTLSLAPAATPTETKTNETKTNETKTNETKVEEKKDEKKEEKKEEKKVLAIDSAAAHAVNAVTPSPATPTECKDLPPATAWKKLTDEKDPTNWFANTFIYIYLYSIASRETPSAFCCILLFFACLCPAHLFA